MYTQCPECRIAFRVTATILQKAGGNVRCGNCSHAFNALAFLSEEPPISPLADETSEKLAETSRRLLETLNELAGPDEVRIEDTGIEWRVVDERGGAHRDNRRDPLRYDDNSPLPDDVDDVDEDDYVPPATAAAGARLSQSGLHLDLALSEPDEWTDLLDEIGDSDPDSLEVEEELAAIHSELAGRDEVEPPELLVEAGIDVTEDASDTGEVDVADLEGLRGEESMTDEVPVVDDEQIARLSAADGRAAGDEAHAEIDLPLGDDGAAAEFDLAFGDDDQPAEIDLAVGDDDAASEVDLVLGGDDEVAEVDLLLAADDDADDGEPAESAMAGDDLELLAESGGWRKRDADGTGADESDDDTDAASVDSATPLFTIIDDEAAAGDTSRLAAEIHVPEPTEQEMTVNMEIDQELLRLAASDDQFSATLVGVEVDEALFDKKPEDVETIIMEGEFILTPAEEQRLASEKAARDRLEGAKLADTYARARGKAKSRRWLPALSKRGMIGGSAVLGLLLLAQWVHFSRESLATNGLFNRTIAPIYRMLGVPVTPAWDIRGWRFEATNGSVDDEQTTLTIVSRLQNTSDGPLPYPLIHVALTDRFEEVMGSRMLEPGDYLPDDIDPSRPVPPGQDFTAVITVAEPSLEATGFKLNACYRVEQGTVRCAVEDFKN